MPDLEYVRREIEHMRVQVGRQRKQILQLQRAGISTASAELLLGRMHAKIDNLCAERETAQEGGGRLDKGSRTWRAELVMREQTSPCLTILTGYFGPRIVFTLEPTPKHLHVKTWNLQTLRSGPVSKRLCVMQRRRRSSPHTFEENIAAEKAKLEAQIAKLKPGPQMDTVLKKIRQLETVAHMSEWLTSPGPQPPRPE